jgi:hypothetical protein
MNVTTPGISFGISGRRLAPIALVIGAGVILSPAFILGAFMTTRLNTLVASILTLLWAFLQWRLIWADYFWNPEIGELFKAVDGRVHGPALAFAFASIVQTVSFLAAGRIARWLYDHHRQSAVPLAVATVSFGFILFGQWNVTSSNVEYARSQGKESGRIEMIAASQKVADAVIADLAQTDREKMLVGYAQRITVKRGVGVEDQTLRLDEYISSLADACAGNDGENAICSNRTLDDIRASKKSLKISQ